MLLHFKEEQVLKLLPLDKLLWISQHCSIQYVPFPKSRYLICFISRFEGIIYVTLCILFVTLSSLKTKLTN